MLISVVIIVLLLLLSYRGVPAMHYGVVSRLGERTGRILNEGPQFVIPLFDKISLYSLEWRPPIQFVAEFTTKNNIHLVVEGALQWRADKDINDPKSGKNMFMSRAEEEVDDGLLTEVDSILSTIGSQHDSDDFKGTKDAVEAILACRLQLSNTPHPEGITNFLEWYQANQGEVRRRLSLETRDQFDYSDTEQLYGVDIGRVKLSKVTFPKEIEDAQQDKKEAELRGDAVVEYNKAGAKLKEEFPGLTDRERLDAVKGIMQEGVEVRVLSVQGEAGIGTLADAMRGKKE